MFCDDNLKNSSFYTGYALESFFKYTEIDNGDEFLLINNDGDKVDKFLIYKKINVLIIISHLVLQRMLIKESNVAKKIKKILCF